MKDRIIEDKRAKNPFLKNTDLAYDLLLEELISGDLRPGDKILQDSYAQKFGMSRTPVRDALLRLENNRFIHKVSSQGGFEVCPLLYSDFCELSKFRSILEEGAVRIALRNLDDPDLEHMSQNIEQTRALKSIEDRQKRAAKLLELDFDFHGIIIFGCNNRYVIDAYQRNYSRLYLYMRIVRTEMYNLSYVVNSHNLIFEALRSRNESQVVQILHNHCAFYDKRSIQEVLYV